MLNKRVTNARKEMAGTDENIGMGRGADRPPRFTLERSQHSWARSSFARSLLDQSSLESLDASVIHESEAASGGSGQKSKSSGEMARPGEIASEEPNLGPDQGLVRELLEQGLGMEEVRSILGEPKSGAADFPDDKDVREQHRMMALHTAATRVAASTGYNPTFGKNANDSQQQNKQLPQNDENSAVDGSWGTERCPTRRHRRKQQQQRQQLRSSIRAPAPVEPPLPRVRPNSRIDRWSSSYTNKNTRRSENPILPWFGTSAVPPPLQLCLGQLAQPDDANGHHRNTSNNPVRKQSVCLSCSARLIVPERLSSLVSCPSCQSVSPATSSYHRT